MALPEVSIRMFMYVMDKCLTFIIVYLSSNVCAISLRFEGLLQSSHTDEQGWQHVMFHALMKSALLQTEY